MLQIQPQNIEKIELPIPSLNGSKMVLNLTQERRDKFIELIKKIGFTNARRRYKDLAKHFDVSERMIHKDFNWIKGCAKIGDMREIKIDLQIARDRVLNEALELFNDAPTIDNALKLIKIVRFCREELEAWGEKPKVAEELNMKTSGDLELDRILEIAEEVRNRD